MSAKKVVLYFDDQRDALAFTLAAGSVMSNQGQQTSNVEEPLARASRIRIGRTVTCDENSAPRSA